jgi:hypothetical protein
MAQKIKHLLPTYSILDHLNVEPELLSQLQTCVRELESEFKSALEVNKKLCGVHYELTSEVYKNFFQISLTDSALPNEEVTIDELEMIAKDFHKDGKIKGMRQKKLLSIDENSIHNEATFVHKTDTYKRYATVFDKLLAKFKGVPTRIRLVKLEAGHSITPHIDYDPSYAVRIIIPVFAEPECVNLFWVKNKLESATLIPGKAYFLNTGYKHAVMNFSKYDRYTFMISINGIEDINHLIK